MQPIPLSTGALVRLATAADNEQIRAIWNYEMQWSNATFDAELRTLEQQEVWLAAHSEPSVIATATTAMPAFRADGIDPALCHL